MRQNNQLSTSEMTKYMYNYGLEGNIVDHTWYNIFRWKKSSRLPEGKPHLEAITILSDVVYWWLNVKIDESSHSTIKNGVSPDLLQRNYSQIEDSFGLTHRESRSAMQTLENAGVAWRVFRTITVDGIKISKDMCIAFDPIRLNELMLKEKEIPSSTCGVSK